MRHQLKDSSVRVVEVVPPMVRTDLLRGSHMRPEGAIDPDVFADSVMQQLLSDSEEISHHTEKILSGDRAALQAVFLKINAIPPVK
jgi:uncharacterized oxidoreductase